jgi:hypothetical protein
MRVAVLADIHGNPPALEAVLRDVQAAGVDAIVLDGDLDDGPMPAQTLERLEELGDRAVWVRATATAGSLRRSTAPSSPAACPPTRPPPTSPGARPESAEPTGTGSPAAAGGHPRHRRARTGDLLPRHRTRRQRVHHRGQPDLPLPGRGRRRPRADRIQASASDAEALAAFNETIEHQAGQR